MEVENVDLRCIKYEAHSLDEDAKVGTVRWERKNWMYQGVNVVKKCVEWNCDISFILYIIIEIRGTMGLIMNEAN